MLKGMEVQGFEEVNKDSGSPTALIAIVTVCGAIVVAAIIAVVVIFYIRHNRK